MANITENKGITRPVAVSSTSSLDSIATNMPPASDQKDFGHTSDSAIQQTVPNPMIPSLSGRFPSTTATTSIAATVSPAHIPIVPSNPSIVPGKQLSSSSNDPANNTVAEFLYQLTKMLTDNNREVIEWSNGKIEVHNPHKLASDVLHKYFRHSKFASFQRQLNYFGFRKLAGKGKMAPCSYVNDAATSDLRSLLLIKRKTTPLTGREKGSKKRERSESATSEPGARSVVPPVNPVLANILHRTSSSDNTEAKTLKVASGKGIKHPLNGYLKAQSVGAPSNNSHMALAQAAVGKGIRHGFATSAPVSSTNNNIAATASAVVEQPIKKESSVSSFTFKDPHQLGMDVQSSLSELSNNFKNSLKDPGADDLDFGMLSRNSSLIDLAMLDPIEPTPVSELRSTSDPNLMNFLDFPSNDGYSSMDSGMSSS